VTSRTDIAPVATPDPREILTLALAASPEPISLDTLVGWDLIRPSELWTLLAAVRAEGVVAERDGGRFEIADPARRDEILARSSGAAWDGLLATPARIGWVVAAANGAAAARRFGAAGAIFRALVAHRPRDGFPDGARGWLGIVLQTLRLFRAMTGIATADLDEAIAVAVALGDMGAQGMLHGALAATAIRDGDAAAGREHLARAREAAAAATGRERAETHMYLALGLVLFGRLREGLDTFEALLGDVPADVAALVEPSSSAPATGLFVIAGAYARAGEGPRALELVDRLRAYGAERGLEAVEREADLFAALAHVEGRELAEARDGAERAFCHYGATGADPMHLWFAAQALLCVRTWEGRIGEVGAVVQRGVAARDASGWPWLATDAVLAALEELEVAGVTFQGLSLEAELERLSSGQSLTGHGYAHHYRARALARAPRDEGDLRAVREHLDRAIVLLREAGASSGLARALADAEALARGGGRAADARRLDAELQALAAQSPAAEGRASPEGSGSGRLTRALVELGRLGATGAFREGTWGEIAARLCRSLAAERCALVEAGPPPRVLGVRGGGAAWREAVVASVTEHAPQEPATLAAPATPGDAAPGRLLVVPFAAEGRSGWACLENRIGPAFIGPEHGELLEVLSAQLGVLLGNLALWQELSATRERLEQENRYWRSTAAAAAPGSRVIGDSPALREVLALVARVAPTTTAVLVTGETGVGKELVATEIHRQSPRRAGPFIAVHVASFSAGLVASALFGHERGAFTGATEQTKGRFELADGGTLFLDEVGELSPEDQVRLLRVLQEGTFERVGGTRPIRSDFRLVAATHRDLQAEVRAGRFREDLYFRLAAFPLRVPPLRERREEIPTLALSFMERASRARGVRFEGIGEADVRRMLEYAWPGNVRELQHVVERAVVLSEPPRLRIPPLDARTRPDLPPAPPRPGDGEAAAGARSAPDLVTLAEFERRHLSAVLRHAGGRITGEGGAAEILGLKPSTLSFRIRKLGLDPVLREARSGGRR
jgi:transcriptional regulator with GAF, ATPase, and Fis domain